MFGSSKASRDAAFTAFVEESGQRLLRTAIALTGSPDAGAELAQASLVKAYVAWPRIRTGEAYAYTRRIMVNERVDRWRATHREVSTDTPPEQSVLASGLTEDRDEVLRLLVRLPEQQRKVVVLRYYCDLSEQATAEMLGISVGAVKSAASRGLATLRAAGAAGARPHTSNPTTNTEAGAR